MKVDSVAVAEDNTVAPAGPPDAKVSVRETFGIDSDMVAPAYSQPDEHVPDIDPDYIF